MYITPVSAVRDIRRLLWAYFWLLLLEGALRKWFLVSLSGPLLLVRDPIVLGMYFLAFRAGIFPKDKFTLGVAALALLSFPAALITTVYTDFSNLSVIFFGLRSNFLHLPLIFLIPKVFGSRDVKRLGRWVLVLSLPMALLMAAQFQAAPGDFLNKGAGEFGAQITSAMGKIRPAGTFSYITGPVEFFALVTAFLSFGILEKKTYSSTLLLSSAVGLALALAVSGSRSALAAAGIVLACLGIGAVLNRRALGGTLRLVVFLGVAVFAVSFLPVFSEGIEVTSTRAEMAGAAEGSIVLRFLRSLTDAFNDIVSIPLLGYGLGVGTNAGASLLRASGFLLAENEWPRLMLESGPVLGGAFIVLRTLLVVFLGKLSFLSAARGKILPVVLFGACAENLLSGQFGQPTTQGFVTLGAGLCLAALAEDRPAEIREIAAVSLPRPV